MFDLTALAAYWGPILVAIALALGIVGTVFKWWGKAWGWLSKLGRRKPTRGVRLPTETIRAVLEHIGSYQGPEWSPASRDGKPGMQVYARWTFTNIANASVKIAATYLDLRPRVHGVALVKHSRAAYHGDYFLHPAHPVPGSTMFFMFPPIRKPGQDLKTTVVLVDNLGNEHRLPVVFRGPPQRCEG